MPRARKRSPQLSVAAEAFDPGEALGGYDNEFLQCRDPGIRHPWEVVGYFDSGSSVRRLSICPRCGCEKRQEIHRSSGMREPAHYSYPEGYKLGGSVGSADIAVELLHRVTVYGSESEAISHANRRAAARRRTRK